jgi:hypothetical protein
MVFADVLEMVMVVAILVFLGTQIIIPLLRGTPYFPLFRRERVLTRQLTEAEEAVREAELAGKVALTRSRAAFLRRAIYLQGRNYGGTSEAHTVTGKAEPPRRKTDQSAEDSRAARNRETRDVQ